MEKHLLEYNTFGDSTCFKRRNPKIPLVTWRNLPTRVDESSPWVSKQFVQQTSLEPLASSPCLDNVPPWKVCGKSMKKHVKKQKHQDLRALNFDMEPIWNPNMKVWKGWLFFSCGLFSGSKLVQGGNINMELYMETTFRLQKTAVVDRKWS